MSGRYTNNVYVLWVVMDDDDTLVGYTSRIIQYPRRKGMALDWIGGSKMSKWLTWLWRQ